jgi:hypothetical protein
MKEGGKLLTFRRSFEKSTECLKQDAARRRKIHNAQVLQWLQNERRIKRQEEIGWGYD